MSSYNEELLKIIRENKNPEQALMTAINVISYYLKEPSSFQEPLVDVLQVLD